MATVELRPASRRSTSATQLPAFWCPGRTASFLREAAISSDLTDAEQLPSTQRTWTLTRTERRLRLAVSCVVPVRRRRFLYSRGHAPFRPPSAEACIFRLGR